MDTTDVVTREELRQLIETKGNYVLIDVREKDELAFGMIPTAENIPLDELEEALRMPADEFARKYHLAKPSKDDVIIFHCRTGGRSAVATQLARALGFVHAKNFKGSIWAWAEIDKNVRRYGPTPSFS